MIAGSLKAVGARALAVKTKIGFFHWKSNGEEGIWLYTHKKTVPCVNHVLRSGRRVFYRCHFRCNTARKRKREREKKMNKRGARLAPFSSHRKSQSNVNYLSPIFIILGGSSSIQFRPRCNVSIIWMAGRAEWYSHNYVGNATNWTDNRLIVSLLRLDAS